MSYESTERRGGRGGGEGIIGLLRLERKLAICLSHSAHSLITCPDPLQAATIITPRDTQLCDAATIAIRCTSLLFVYSIFPDVGLKALFIFLF